MQKASATHRQALPRSLRARLALLEHGVVPVPPPKTVRMQRQRGRSRRPLAGTSFGVGFACGGLLGAVLLLVLMFAQSDEARSRWAAAPPDASASPAPDLSAQSAEGSGHLAAAASTSPSSPLANEDLQWGPASVSRARGVATPFRTEVRAMPRAEERADAAMPRPPLPEGSSGLGGPTGGPAQQEQRRQVWWTIPTPTWAPFADGSSGN